MNDFIRNIMNNPNFGRALQESPAFRSVFERMSGGTTYASYSSQFNIDLDPDTGQIRLKDIFGEVFQRKPDGESFTDYLNRSIMTMREGFSQIRNYGVGSDQFFSGGQTNFVLDTQARNAQLSARVISYKSGEGADSIVGKFIDYGRKGFAIPDQEQINMIQMFNSRGEAMPENVIMRALGIVPPDPNQLNPITGKPYTIDPSIFKRMKFFSSDREIGRVAANGQDIVGLLFDPTEVFGSIPQKAAFARKFGGANIDDAFQIMSDGANIVTEAGLKNSIEYMKETYLDVLEKDLRKLKEGSIPYRQKQRQIQAMQKEINKLELALKEGKLPGGFNFRAFGAKRFGDEQGRRLGMFKGDAVYLTNERLRYLMRTQSKYKNLTDNEIDKILSAVDFISSVADEKGELVPLPGFGHASMTMFHQPAVRTGNLAGNMAFSNSMTMATFAGQMDPRMGDTGERYLIQSLRYEIQDAIVKVQNGEITPGLLKLIEDYNLDPPPGLSPAELAEFNRSKLYARRLRSFIDNGGDLKSNPFMAQQALDLLKSHHFRRKYNLDGSVKRLIMGGIEVDALAMRLPMRGSVRTHMFPDALIGAEVPMGTASFDPGLGRFVYNAADAIAARMAQGGSDFDDALYKTLKFDTKTRRLLYHSLRDPTALGEFMYYDVDLRTDPSVPKAIREAAIDLEAAKTRLLGSRNVAQTSKDLAIIQDKINTINNFIMDSTMDPKKLGEVTGRDIAKVDLMDIYANPDTSKLAVAPKGTVLNTSGYVLPEKNVLLGLYGPSDIGDDKEYLRLLREQAAIVKRSNTTPFSLFQFKEDGYVDFLDPNSRFGALMMRSDALEEAKLAKKVATGSYSDAAILRIWEELTGQGVLGKFVNERTIIERALDDLIDIRRMGAGSTATPEQLRAFQAESLEKWKALKFIYAETEDVIDTAIKTGNLKILDEIIPEIMRQNAVNLGKFIRDRQLAAGLAGINIDIGIDPYLYQERGLTMAEEVLRGYYADQPKLLAAYLQSGDASALLLPESSPLAYMSETFHAAKDVEGLLGAGRSPMGDEVIPDIARNLLTEFEEANFTPTALEVTRAQEFVREYQAQKKLLDDAFKDPRRLAQIIDDNIGEVGDLEALMKAYMSDSIEANSLVKLRNWGLFDDIDNLDRQLAAIGQLLARQMANGDTNISFDPIMRGSTLMDGERLLPSIQELYQQAEFRVTGRAAKLEESTFEAFRNMRHDNWRSVVGKFFRQDQDGKWLPIRSAIPEIHQERLFQIILDQVDNLIDEVESFAESTYSHKASKAASKNEEKLIKLWDDIAEAQSLGSSGPIDYSLNGVDQYLRRSAADEAAEAVVDDASVSMAAQLQKRLNRQALKELYDIPGVRGTTVGLGLFAGFGLLYGMTRDRTYEDMQGPPLLPGGSPYENYEGIPAAMASTYSSVGSFDTSGVIYRIRAQGSFDSAEVRDRISSITGSPIDTRVSAVRQTISAQQSSVEMINELIGK